MCVNCQTLGLSMCLNDVCRLLKVLTDVYTYVYVCLHIYSLCVTYVYVFVCICLRMFSMFIVQCVSLLCLIEIVANSMQTTNF
jgi:hypothetical protein